VPAEIQWAGAGYLTAVFEPFSIGANPAREGYRVRDLEVPVPPERFERRREMLKAADPLEPEDIAATIYSCLGIDFTQEHRTPQGRPVKVLGRGTAAEDVLLQAWPACQG
jgi:hypothetical protein